MVWRGRAELGGHVRMSGGKSRMIRGIWRKAHSRRRDLGGYWKIAKSLGIGAKSFVSLAAKAVGWLVSWVDQMQVCGGVGGLTGR